MRAYIVSLPSAASRRVRIAGLLDGQIAHEFVDAIAGKDIADTAREVCPAPYNPRFRRTLSLNEIACCLSHRKALQTFLDSGEQLGLILEDDAHIAPGVVARVNGLLANMPEFDLLKIGGWSSVAGFEVATHDGMKIFAANKMSVGAHAYIVSRRGAAKLVASIVPVRDQYDTFLRNAYVHQCDAYEVWPSLVWQDDGGESMIGGSRAPVGRHSRLSPVRLYHWWRHSILRTIFSLRRFGVNYVIGRGFSVVRHPH
jgi:glycosyl transferase family 25